MNGLAKTLLFFAVLAVGNVVYKLNQTTPIEPLPESWWGPGGPTEEDAALRPFKVQVPDKVLADLKDRLTKVRDLTPPLEGIQQQYGLNTNLLKEIVEFWRTKYDWRDREKFLNQYPQFKTRIQGLDIHFIHVKPSAVPKGGTVLPLLLLHGWPGSVREFFEVIPLLTTPQKDHDFVFELIIPSLPGYGFSQAAAKPGLGTREIAVVFRSLMRRVGFEKFYVQGGDWGSAVASDLASWFPENVKGIHLNMCVSNAPMTTLKLLVGSLWPRLVVDAKNEHRLYPLSDFFSNALLEFGYMHIQATKPDTVGVALNDSPVGLAAYILEKFIAWTDPAWKDLPDGGLTKKYTYTNLLDNVMIYWVTGSITTSVRLYSEALNKKQNALTDHIPVTIPSACALFDNEVIYQPESLIRHRYQNLVHVGEYHGGHFAAFEVPESLAKDVWIAVSKMQKKASKK